MDRSTRCSRRTVAAAATALTASAVATLGAAPAFAAAPAYVALGDSYSSGTGTRSYLSDGTSCLRSVYAYPSLIAAARGYALNLRACSGATVADVTNAQLGALDAGTAYVSITVGGNDAGFASVLTSCAQPSWASNCDAAVNGAQSFITGTLPGRLAALYSAIRAKAPNARVTVAGYPRIFNGRDCSLLTFFSSSEMTRLNATADLLNATTAKVATDAGFTFANPTTAFVGHAVCDTSPWLNNLTSPTTESFHPNRSGHASGYTPTVSPTLTGATVTATTAVVRTAERASADQAERQRRYAAQDRTIEPAVVRVPDLHSPELRAAARRAGVDVDDPASVAAADRLWTARQDAARQAAQGG
jgi:lysophospholipase L1-like esterase